jgi:hypothetical protein
MDNIVPYLHTHQAYALNGKEVPSVTTILGIISKPYLMKWANNLGLRGKSLADENKHTFGIGTLLHAKIEGFLKNTEVDTFGYTPTQRTIAEACFKKFLKWWESQEKITAIYIEKSFVSKRGYGGTVDAFLEINGLPTIVDWKTSKAISSDYYIQLSAYIQLLEDNGEEPKQVAILRTPKDDSIAEYVVFDAKEVKEAYFKVFESAMRLYNDLSNIR